MITGLTKREKTTEIFFDEAGAFITVRTHNTDLKSRLSRYCKLYPEECRLVAKDREIGLLEFEIKKGRLSFRLTAPYPAERRKALSKNATLNNHLPLRANEKRG